MSDYVLLVEIELDSGTVRLSPTGEQTPAGWYQHALVGIDRIEREVALLPGEMRRSDCRLTISNIGNLVSVMKAEPMRNRTVRIRCGPRSAGLGALATVFTGAIQSVEISPESAVIAARDTSLDRFDLPPTPRIARGIFPSLPATTPRDIIPVIYGDMSLAAWGGSGAVRCYRITNSSPYEYLVAGHRSKAVDHVYVYRTEVSSGFSIVEKTYAGRTCTVISFTGDPRDPDRPNEDEVTADVRGVMDGSGNLVENPVEQLRHFLSDVIGLGASGLDTDAFDEASALADAYGYKGAAWISGNDRAIDVINRFAQSFTMPFFLSRSGKAAVALLVAQELFGLEGERLVTDAADVVSGSFAIASNDNVASGLCYKLVYDALNGNYIQLLRQDAEGEAGRIGGEVLQELELPYVRDVPTANRVAATRLMFHTEAREFVRMQLPADFMDLELTDCIALTHYAGVAADGGGYRQAPCLVAGLTSAYSPADMGIEARAVRLLGEDEHADSHSDDHIDASHVDVPHADTGHADSHTDVAHLDAEHQDYHLDEHADSHSDAAHSDAGHGDFHGDAAHADVPHDDSHGDAHSDVAHGDTAHADTPHYDQYWDLHEDQHGDYSNGEHLDEHSDDHTDYYVDEHTDQAHEDSHTDAYTDWHSDQAHTDGPHNDWHSDTEHLDSPHSDSHVDVPHGDEHADVAHEDAHGNSHSDAAHQDAAYQDAAHGDTPHEDFHADSDAHTDTHWDDPYQDAHNDIPHEDSHSDVTHEDSHSDVAHEDAHGDTHSDAHTDSHGDTAHSDSHGDVGHADCTEDAHLDGYEDAPHYDRYYDGTHYDNGACEHVDWHTDDYSGGGQYHMDDYFDQHYDTPHTDTHGDVSHSDTHGDVPHEDSHTNWHSDQAHSDSYSDVAHQDTHADVGHMDTHLDVPYGDYHWDAAHSDSYTDVPHSDTHSDVAHTDSHTDSSPHGDTHADTHGDEYSDYWDIFHDGG